MRCQSADFLGWNEVTVNVNDIKDIDDTINRLIVGKDFFRYRLEKVCAETGKLIVLTHYIKVL